MTQNEDGSIEIADKLDTLDKPCYDMAGLTRQYDFLTTVSRYCNELGWGNYANDHEDANGQFEQNFEYADALTTCDRAIFFRYMVHTLAEQHGLHRDLHAEAVHEPDRQRLPLAHVALEGRRRTCSRDESDPRGLGLSSLAYHFVGGLKAHARAYSALTAPTVNSYKRLKLGLDLERRDLVAGLDLVRLQQPHADAADPGPGPDRGPHDRRLVQPVPRGGRGARVGPRRDREGHRRRRAELARTCTASRTTS